MMWQGKLDVHRRRDALSGQWLAHVSAGLCSTKFSPGRFSPLCRGFWTGISSASARAWGKRFDFDVTYQIRLWAATHGHRQHAAIPAGLFAGQNADGTHTSSSATPFW